jgi:cation-transporting ATPase 13A2
MVELIKECRAALSTNYSLFNIMALYSLIQYTTVIVCQFYYSYPSDFQFLYWDLFCNFFFFLTFAYTGTHPLLSKQAPKASLFTVSNTVQVFLIFGLQLMGQILMMVGLAQIFPADINYYNVGSESVNFERYQADGDLAVDTPETSILFLFTTLMYIATLLAFSISRPWRKEFFTNIPFMIVLVFSLTYSIVMILVPGARLALFDIKYLDYAPLNSYIVGVGLGLGAVIYLIQKCLM